MVIKLLASSGERYNDLMSDKINDDKQAILNKLRRGQIDEPLPPIPQWQVSPSDNAAGVEGLVKTFIDSAHRNLAQTARLDSLQQLPDCVAGYLAQYNLPRRVLAEKSLINLPWQPTNITVDNRPPTDEDSCGITTIRGADVQTGAMLISNQIEFATTLSLLPPHHIAVIHPAQLFYSLDSLMQSIDRPLPSVCQLIAGPSRTADIEQEMIIGMHGPTHVLIVIVG